MLQSIDPVIPLRQSKICTKIYVQHGVVHINENLVLPLCPLVRAKVHAQSLKTMFEHGTWGNVHAIMLNEKYRINYIYV